MSLGGDGRLVNEDDPSLLVDSYFRTTGVLVPSSLHFFAMSQDSRYNPGVLHLNFERTIFRIPKPQTEKDNEYLKNRCPASEEKVEIPNPWSLESLDIRKFLKLKHPSRQRKKRLKNYKSLPIPPSSILPAISLPSPTKHQNTKPKRTCERQDI